MDRSRLILALDQSTSATKAVLFDATGRLVDKAARSHRQIYPQPGWVEHDAEEIWRNVLVVIRELARRNQGHLSKLSGLSITNQRETVVVFEQKSGRPLHHALVWQDRRGDALCRRLARQGLSPTVRRKTGLKIDTYFSASKLRWLVENKRAIAGKLASGEAVIGTMDAYLIHRLTGGAVFATDYTNASRTLLFDIGKLRWDAQLWKLFRVPVRALPEVRESAARFGVTDAGGILPSRVPIVGVMGDSQSSLFAQGCFTPGMAKATFGTGTSVLVNIGSRFRTSRQGAVTALAWVWRGEPTYAFEGLINFSAATLEWLRQQLGLFHRVEEIGKLAASVPDNGGVYLVPAFAGLSAPYWSPAARAAIVGLSAHSRKAHVARAAFESIAFQIRDVLELMQQESGRPLRCVKADGGPTRNRLLMQLTADLTRRRIEVAEVAESSAWGAALNGLLGLGVYGSLSDLAKPPRREKSFRPQLPPARAAASCAGWSAAVQRVL